MMSNDFQPYFLVYNPETGYTKFRHESYFRAREEAQRLARLHVGQSFVVLVALAEATIPVRLLENDACHSINLMRRDPDDEIPF